MLRFWMLLEERLHARNLARFLAQPADYDRRVVASLLRLQRNEQPAVIRGRIGSAGADGGVDVFDRRIGFQHLDQRLLPLLHRLEGGVGGRLGDADQEAGVLLREEALRHDHVEVDGAAERRQRHEQHQRLPRQHPVERPFVGAQPRTRTSRSKTRSTTFGFLVASCARSTRAHSIGVSVSDTKSGHDDGDRDRHREFAEHAADDAAHQQHRNEHGDQRERDRDDGEADLARALQRSLERPHAVLDVADDVFQHDDGVVDHEADRRASAPAASCC